MKTNVLFRGVVDMRSSKNYYFNVGSNSLISLE